MKKLFLKTMVLVLCFVLINCTYAFAYAPGNGIYDAGSSDFYNAGRELILRSSTPALTQEFADLIAEKEATLYAENGIRRATSNYPSSYRVSPMFQYAQENSYYCGPAAVKSVLSAESLDVSQSTLAGNNYLQTDRYSSTPWYITNGSSAEDYPVYNTLHAFSDFPYFPSLIMRIPHRRKSL